jgi:endonuclease/exonuclease/phosphatase family metal-dependent hydrolase
MRILSWNIQYGRGVDGRIDLPRICDRIVGFGDPDVICLQEVAAGFDRIDGGVDQVARLARLFPAYQVLYRPGLEWLDGPRPRRFGNLMLSRLPVYELQSHPLPRPPDPKHRHMPRHLLQILVAAPAGPLRIATTHLEYFSALQRDAQVARIVELEAEWSGGDDAPPLGGRLRSARSGAAISTSLPTIRTTGESSRAPRGSWMHGLGSRRVSRIRRPAACTIGSNGCRARTRGISSSCPSASHPR